MQCVQQTLWKLLRLENELEIRESKEGHEISVYFKSDVGSTKKYGRYARQQYELSLICT
jgi:hypothetical protein